MFDSYPISWCLNGQSNAVGQDFSYNCPASYISRNGQSFIYNTQNKIHEICQVGINNLNEPCDFFNAAGTKPRNGVKMGIEVALNKLLADEYRCKTYLYKYAWSGSSLIGNGTYNGTWDPQVRENCFDRSLYYLFEGTKKVFVTAKKPKFIVWIQGEQNVANHAIYAQKLAEYITMYRARLGYSIHFVIVSLSTQQTALNASDLANFKIAQKSLAKVVYTASTGLITTQTGGATIDNVIYVDQNESCIADNIHYTAQACCNIAEYIFATRDYLGIR